MLNFNGLSNEFSKELTRVSSDKVIGASDLTKLKEIANSEKGNKKDKEFIEFLHSKTDQELIQFKASGTGSSNSTYNLRLDESDTADISRSFRGDDIFKYVEVKVVDNNNDITDGLKRLDVKYTEHLSGLGSFDTSIFYDSRVDEFNALAKGKPFVESYKKNGHETFAINTKSADFSGTLDNIQPPLKPHNTKDSTDNKTPSVSEKVADLQTFLNEKSPSGKEIKVNGILAADTIFALGNVYARALQDGDKKTIQSLKPLMDKLAEKLATAEGMADGHVLTYSLQELSTAGKKVEETREAFEHAMTMGRKAIESAEKGNLKEAIEFKKKMFEKSGSEETTKLLKGGSAYTIIFDQLQQKLEAAADKYVMKQYLAEAPLESLLGPDGKVKRPELETAQNILKSGALSYQSESLLKKKLEQIEGLSGKEDKAKWDAQEMESGILRSKMTTLSDSELFFKAFDDTAGVGFMNKQNPKLSVAALQVAEKSGLLYTEIGKLNNEQVGNLTRHVLAVDNSPAGRQLARNILELRPQLENPAEEYCLKKDEINKIKNGPAAPVAINPVLFSEALKEALTFPANDEVAALLMKSVIYGDIEPKQAFNKLSDGDLRDLLKLSKDSLSRHHIPNGGGQSADTADTPILQEKIRQAGRNI
jgi:hypothetical protein